MLPGPSNVPSQVMRAMLKPIINHRGSEFRELYRRIVENAKYVFETEGDVIVLSSSGTGGVECTISNITSHGDKILVPVNGVFSERVKEAVEIFGGKCVELPVEWGKAPTIQQIEDAIKSERNVKAIVIVYNETSTGATTRCLPEIGDLCRENNILFVVDAISILAGDELPVDRWGVDICVTGSQKCLMCPPGLALISVNERAWSAIEAMRQRRYYFDLRAYREFQKEYETPFTPVLPLFYALDEALQMIKQEGLESVFRRHRICAEAIYSAVEAIGLQPFPSREFRSRTVVGIKNPPGIRDKDLRDLLLKKYNVVVGGGMGKLRNTMFRIGVMGTVSQSEILQTVSALECALLDLGHKLQLGAGIAAANQSFAKSQQ